MSKGVGVVRFTDPDRLVLPDGRFTWAEDHTGPAPRSGLVADLGLAGAASWRPGFDDPGVWPMLAD